MLSNRHTLATALLLLSTQAIGHEYDVSFKGAHNKYFVNENNGGKTVNSNRSSIGPWERMTLIELSNNCVQSGYKVAIM